MEPAVQNWNKHNISDFFQYIDRKILKQLMCLPKNYSQKWQNQTYAMYANELFCHFQQYLQPKSMMKSSIGNIFCVTGPLCGESHRSPMNFAHKGQWPWSLMFSLICIWINGWVNNRQAGDLRRHRAHYDVTVMWKLHQQARIHHYGISRICTICILLNFDHILYQPITLNHYPLEDVHEIWNK